MIYLQWIITVAGVLTAIGVIWKAIVFFVHLSDDLKDIKRHTRENYLTGLRLTVMSEDMPLGERIIAGDDYLKEGGNGEVKHFIENELHAKEKVKQGGKISEK